MNAIVELLDQTTQTHFRQALDGKGLDRIANALSDETLAALAVVGQHPASLRGVAVALMPVGPRADAYAHKLVVCGDGEARSWGLSESGGEICTVLAAVASAATPEPSDVERRRAELEYAKLLAEAAEDLQLDENGTPREGL